jgi:hypothetical protein
VEKSSGLFHAAFGQKARSIVNRQDCISSWPPVTKNLFPGSSLFSVE